MNKQWENGFHAGEMEGYKAGKEIESANSKYAMAHQMRVLFCALITAHKQNDDSAFWATVEITKSVLNQHASFSEDDWAIFRGKTQNSKDEK